VVTRDIVVGIATGYGFDDRGFGVRVPVGSRIFSSSSSSDRPWSPPNLLFHWYGGPATYVYAGNTKHTSTLLLSLCSLEDVVAVICVLYVNKFHCSNIERTSDD
jgi:hypothetical protein